MFRYAKCKQEGRAKLCCAFKAGEGWPLHFALIQSTMVTSVVLLCLGIVILVLLLRSQRPKNFPPGPLALPLLGTILEVALDNPLQDFERVRKTANNDFWGIFNFLICVINSCDLELISVVLKIFEGSAHVTFVCGRYSKRYVRALLHQWLHNVRVYS